MAGAGRVAAAATLASALAAAIVFWRKRAVDAAPSAKLIPILTWLPTRLAVVRLPAGPAPAWATQHAAGPFSSVTYTAEETSVILEERRAPTETAGDAGAPTRDLVGSLGLAALLRSLLATSPDATLLSTTTALTPGL